jgi:hypothetical protein
LPLLTPDPAAGRLQQRHRCSIDVVRRRRQDAPRCQTSGLRRRYLALILDGMRAADCGDLPGSPPGWPEISERWNAG